MIVDAHAHWGNWYFPIAQLSVEDIVAYMQAQGIDVTILSSSLAIAYDFCEGNRRMAEAIEPYPQLLGYVVVNSNYVEESIAEMRRYLGAEGYPQFLGIKVHPLLAQHRYDTPQSLALTGAMAEYGLPVLIHTFGSPLESPWNVLPAAQAYPDLPIILAHMGGNAWWEGVRVAQESTNLYLEICSTWTDPEKIRAAIDAVGPKRVLFGTDATLFEAAHMLGTVEDAGLSSEEYALVMGENARRLFRLD
ncbi:MAG: amidohydrolase family protein [Chloroflexota bacterium]|nr:amidohydrolase family protein [Chloroflexota bacterium]